MSSKMDWKNGARLSEVNPASAQGRKGGYPGVEKAGLREIFSLGGRGRRGVG